MTGMEHAIEQAARAEAERKSRDEHWCGDLEVFAAGAKWAVAHLRKAGLLAPAPLRKVRASGALGPSGLLHPYAEKQTEYVRFHTGWLPVDRDEGDGRAGQWSPSS